MDAMRERGLPRLLTSPQIAPAGFSLSSGASSAVPGVDVPRQPGQCVERLSLRVVRLSGAVLLDVREDDLVWPDENRELDASDVFTLIRIGGGKQCLFDLYRSDTAQNQEPLEYSDQVHFGNTYTIVERSCARCTLCRAGCTRSGDHSLCSHGSFAHLWCRPQHRSGDNETKRRRTVVEVEGYLDGCGLRTRFPYDKIITELTSIERERV